MIEVPVRLATTSYIDESRSLSIQRLVNLYFEAKPDGSKMRSSLSGVPGFTQFAAVGTGPIRGMLPMGDKLFVVSGPALYTVTTGGVSTILGAVGGTDVVSMARDGTSVFIANGTNVYWADATSMGLVNITNIDSLTFQDGYILMSEKDTEKFFINDILNDARTVDPSYLEFGVSNSVPDKNRAIVNMGRAVYVFGEESVQVYFNTGNADFPFERSPSGVIERGTVSGKTVKAHRGALMWLGDDLRVYIMDGETPRPVSTVTVENLIRSYGTPSSARALMYEQSGHVFYVLTVPNKGTVCYDTTVDRWHERKSTNRPDWTPSCYAFWDQRRLVGSGISNGVFLLDQESYTDEGGLIRREMTSPVLWLNGHRAILDRFELFFESGISPPAGEEASLMLSYTDDNGLTWSPEIWRKVGKTGSIGQRTQAVWTRLGMFRSRTLRIAMLGAAKCSWFEGLATITQGAR